MFVLNAHCPNLFNQLRVVYFIKETFYIKFYDIMQIAFLQSTIGCLDCIFHTSHWSKSIAVVAELSFTDWFHNLLDTLLY